MKSRQKHSARCMPHKMCSLNNGDNDHADAGHGDGDLVKMVEVMILIIATLKIISSGRRI